MQPKQPGLTEEAPWQSDEATDIIMKNSGVVERVGGDRAFYNPISDHIQRPPSVAFKSGAEECCTRIHELAHATGAKHRLDRDNDGRVRIGQVCEEEIYAELSSSFIGTTLNLPADIPNHANYIHHWLTRMKEEPRFIFRAAATAQKISDWILNLHPDWKAQIEPQPDRPGILHDPPEQRPAA